MTEKPTSASKARRYAGQQVDIIYSLRRCIHAEACVKQLAEVFDKQKRPWISPDGAIADRVAEVVMECPSGALHFERKDGGAIEPIPAKNTVIVRENSWLQVRGDLHLQGAAVELDETRVALCRCGASNNKPFCDNTHLSIGFQAQANRAKTIPEDHETGGTLTVIPNHNGPLELQGNIEIFSEAGELLYAGNRTWLCRCGGSGNKPFCDGTHNKNGFTAE